MQGAEAGYLRELARRFGSAGQGVPLL
jgi:hypothetical protein